MRRMLVIWESKRMGVSLLYLNGLAWVDKGVGGKFTLSHIGIKVLHLNDLFLAFLDVGLIQVFHIKEPVQGVVLEV
jgi:hypothetical protein